MPPVRPEANAPRPDTVDPAEDGGGLTPRGRATRERLLEAASRAFAEYGFTGTRVTDIVRFADLSHGAFYRYFDNKEDALVAVLRPKMEALRAASRGVPITGDEHARLVEVSTRFFSTYALDRRLFAVVREAVALDTAGFRQAWLEERQPFVDRVTRWIERLVADGRIPAPAEPRLVAEGLGALTEQLAYVHIALAPRQPRPEEIDALGRACAHIWYATLFQAPQEAP
jgi:AcrR family transcriptional regulator